MTDLVWTDEDTADVKEYKESLCTGKITPVLLGDDFAKLFD